jgi:VWFA-related protein
VSRSPARLLLPGLLLSCLAATAQQPPPPEAPPLRVDVQLVNVDVTVVDAQGEFVSGLTARNFRLREDGAPQTVAHFLPTQAPVRIALLVEASPAVFLIRYDHLAAAHFLLTGLRTEDEVALLRYARATRAELDFTRDKAGVEQRLHAGGRFGFGMADLRLLDAVAATLDWLGPPPARTAVVVIGTGLDSGSRMAWEELERRAGASQITFFAVATGRLLRAEPEGKGKTGESGADAAFAEADARLRALAEATAGEAYFPESADDLERIYREIAERLRNVYSLGYYPTNRARDGAYRQISVELVDDTGQPLTLRDAKGNRLTPRVFARPGYFAPRD